MSSALPDLCSLRDAMARIEGLGGLRDPLRETGFAPALRPTERGGSRRVPLGADALPLDGILGGGLRRGTLHEIVAESPRDQAAASGFAATLAGLVARGAMVVWIVDDRVAWETGTPYRPGLAAHGLDPSQLILVKTKDASTTLWATEEALRAGAPVVLTELWRAKSYDLAASRRLLLAARRRGATNLVLHVGLHREDEVSSGAETRFAVAASPSDRMASAGHHTPIPGPAGFAVRLLKLRGGDESRLGAFDRDQIHRLAWDRTTGRFRRPAQSFEPWHQVARGAQRRGDAA